MELREIKPVLTEIFPDSAVEMPSETAWQVELSFTRLLLVASDDGAWLRLMMPLAPQAEAQDVLEALLALNFDLTQTVHYALHEEVLWAVFLHRLASLTAMDLQIAIQHAAECFQHWQEDTFLQTTDKQLRQIVKAAKQQGQTLEATLQNIDRFYQEGILGDLAQTPEEREKMLAAWRSRLQQHWERLEAEEE